MNQQFLRQLRQTLDKIPASQVNPLDSFKKSICPGLKVFNFRTQLEPQLLNLINKIIESADFPARLKLTKIILIMLITLIEGWRPINIVPANFQDH